MMKDRKQCALTPYLLWAFLIAWALQIAAGLMYRRGNGMVYTALLSLSMFAPMLAAVFVLSRALSAWTMTVLRSARPNGMLDGFARHGLFDVSVTCRGDLDVDCHHTIEDIGIALGTAIKEALGDKAGLVRYGSCMLPMDETLALCAVDLGGRPHFVYDASFAGQSCGGMDTQMAREFFYAVSYSAMMNLHLKVLYGENDHHKLEAMFKAFAKALDAATRRDARIDGVLSTKGTL